MKIGTTRAGQLLEEHPGTVLAKAKRGEIPAEFTDTGRAIFNSADIERLVAERNAAAQGGNRGGRGR